MTKWQVQLFSTSRVRFSLIWRDEFCHGFLFRPAVIVCNTQNVIETLGGVLRHLICVFYTLVSLHLLNTPKRYVWDSQYTSASSSILSINSELYFLLYGVSGFTSKLPSVENGSDLCTWANAHKPESESSPPYRQSPCPPIVALVWFFWCNKD